MGLDGSVRAGGYFPGYSNTTIESIKFPDTKIVVFNRKRII